MNTGYDLLKTFVATAHAGTFAAASRDLRISVSAVSQKIRLLEAQLGLQLFERVGRRVALRPAGLALSQRLQVGFQSLDEAVASFRGDFEAVKGRVTVGSPRTFGSYWLRPRLAAMLTRWPALRLEVQFDVPSVLETKVLDGGLDIAIIARPVEHPGLQAVPIAAEQFVAVAAPQYLKREGTPRTHADFVKQRWAIFDADQAMHRPWWQAAFGRRAALPADLVCQVASLDELLALAEGGAVMTVLPDYFVKEALKARRLIEVKPAAPGRHLATARNDIFLVCRSGAIRTARFTSVFKALSQPPGFSSL